jgi:hypothetical protein
MYNKKVLIDSLKKLGSAKAPTQKKDMIIDPMGQWAHPGENTRIPSNRITMKGVNYPVLGIANTGQKQMMQPGQEYNFPGADYVDEYPQMRSGGLPNKKNSKKYSRSLDATNRLFAEHPWFKKPKSRKNKIYDPNAKYYQGGGTIWVENEDDPRYKDYLIRQGLYNYSNNPNFNLRSWGAIDLSSAIQNNDFSDFNNTYYDTLLSNLNKDKPSGDLSDDDRDFYESLIDQNVGPYGSNVNYQTLGNDQLHTDRDYNDAYFWLKDLEQSNDFFKNYPPINWQKKQSYASEPYGFNYQYLGPTANYTNWTKPNTLLIEDEINRNELKKVYPNLTDAQIDKWIEKSRKEPPFLTRIIAPGGYATYADTYNNNQQYIANPNKKTFIDANGNIGYLPENMVDRPRRDYDYIPTWGKPETVVKVLPPPIKIGPPPTLEHGELPELQPGNFFSEPLPEAPQYELEPYTDERLRLSIEPGKTKSKKHTKRLFGHGQKYSWHTYKPTKDLEFGKKEVTKPIAALVQKLTGYDPKYFEGYYDEEGNYIPGELEIANELGNKVEFRGAASLRDYINQQKYAKEYDEYQKKLDEWDERYEQSKAEHPLFKYIKGGTTCPEGFEYINGQCVPIVNDCEDEQCRETDQIQEIYNNALDIPRRVVDYEFGIEDLTNQKYAGNARLAWKSQGVKSFVEPSCMYVAGLGWRCAPATKEYMSHFDPVNFNSNIGFIHAVDRGDLPFTRVGKFSDKNFDDQSKGNMRIGDVVNFKGADNSHGETFVGYKEDGTPMYIDSNGNPSNYSTHSLWTPLRPNTTGKGRDYAYVNRFDTERYINDVHGDEIQALEEKARTNPTMIYKDEDLPYLKTLPVQPLEHNFQVGDVIKQKGGLSTSGMMGVRPNPMVASDQAIGAYYNMRPSQVDAEINQMIQENPELQFIPRERLRRGTSPGFIGADSRIYSDPTTIEGSARNYENYIEAGNPSIFPMRKFGGQMTEEKITILNKFFR